MNKRTFIKLSSTLMTAPFILPVKDLIPNEKLINWAGNIEYSTGNILYPATLAEVQQAVTTHNKLKVLGTRHCFNRIADSKHQFISSRKLNNIISLDTDARTVTVEAGIKYGELSPWLNEKGCALHNLASLPHISVAGAVTTATHGSGVKNGNLATAVSGLEMVLADGSIVQLTAQDGDAFKAAVVGLGALGVITKVTLNVIPAFIMRQYVYQNLPIQQLQQHFDAIISAGYSVSLFTDWTSDSINEVWIKSSAEDANNTDAQEDFFGAKKATKNLHPIAELSAENCTEQMGVPGAWYERMPHFKMGFTPSSGKELQSEYFVPRQHGAAAFMAIQQLGKIISPHLFISEIRTIAADDLWMSPCYQQDSVALHFTWKQEWEAVRKLLPQIENALAPFNAKPHWGKLFTMPAQVLSARHQKMDDFKQTIARYDPDGKFRNGFLEESLYR